MKQGTVGLHIQASDPAGAVKAVEDAERLGVKAAWMTSGGMAMDGLTIAIAAAARTSNILLGTSITHLFSRHPLILGAQAAVAGSIAPGRFRLGVGPGTPSFFPQVYGIGYPGKPLAALKANLSILRAFLQEGTVDMEEAGVVAHGKLNGPAPNIPVLASALRPASFTACGEAADGAITWVCPETYVLSTALPRLQEGARKAGRATPAMVMHVPVSLSNDVEGVRKAVRGQLPFYVKVPHYQGMFEAAGFPEARQGEWSDAMIDGVAVHGAESTVAARLKSLFAKGVTEVIATVLNVDGGPSREATMRFLAAV